MIFEIGKTYIVDVTEKGIMPLMEFDKDRWFDKNHDDLDFLTDEEKVIIINVVLNKLRAEIEALEEGQGPWIFKDEVLQIIDKYKSESENP